MSNQAKRNLDFVKSLNGRDKNGGKQLTLVEKKKLFVLKINCPCLSCATLDRATFYCPVKKSKVNPYKPRECESHQDAYRKQVEQTRDSEESAESADE